MSVNDNKLSLTLRAGSITDDLMVGGALSQTGITSEEILAIGAMLGRQAASDYLVANAQSPMHRHRATMIQSEEFEAMNDFLRQIDARLGVGTGSRAASTMSRRMVVHLARDVAFIGEMDDEDRLASR